MTRRGTSFLVGLGVRLAHRLLKRLASLDSAASHPRAASSWRRIERIASRMMRRDLGRDLGQRFDGRVAHGPFRGLRLPAHSGWGDGDFVPKLLGVYEEEVLGILEGARDRRFDILVNIGCAEGFWAVGAARTLDVPRVVAVDLDPEALAVCRESARENGVADRFEYLEQIDGQGLRKLAHGHPRALVISDCEGYERELFDEQTLESLQRADLIVECHDFVAPDTTAELARRFSKTHEVRVVREGARDPNRFEELAGLSSNERWIAMSENRPERMSWIHATPFEA